MDEKVFRRALCLAMVYLAAQDDRFSAAMDYLVAECTDEQWEEAQEMNDEVLHLLNPK